MSHSLVVAELSRRGEHSLAVVYVRTAGFYEVIDSITDRSRLALRRIIFPALTSWLIAHKVESSLINPFVTDVVNTVAEEAKDKHKKLSVIVLSSIIAVLFGDVLTDVIASRMCSTMPSDEYCRLMYSNKSFRSLSWIRRKKFLLQYYSGKSEAGLKKALNNYTNAAKTFREK